MKGIAATVIAVVVAFAAVGCKSGDADASTSSAATPPASSAPKGKASLSGKDLKAGPGSVDFGSKTQ